MTDDILVVQRGHGWAVMHKGSFLGFTMSRDEAALLGQDLVDGIRAEGRLATLIVDEPQTLSALR
jgi:hypothetical protein